MSDQYAKAKVYFLMTELLSIHILKLNGIMIICHYLMLILKFLIFIILKYHLKKDLILIKTFFYFFGNLFKSLAN